MQACPETDLTLADTVGRSALHWVVQSNNEDNCTKLLAELHQRALLELLTVQDLNGTAR